MTSNDEGDFIGQAWAKLDRPVEGPRRWNSLVAHGTDVAAVLEALAQSPIIAARLSNAAGRTVCPVDVARLGVLACLHDFGKANRGFWGRQFSPGNPQRQHDAGHIAETRVLFHSRPLSEALRTALGADRIARWGDGVLALLVASLSHHGSPICHRIKEGWGSVEDDLWMPAEGYDPARELERLRDAAFAMFPESSQRGSGAASLAALRAPVRRPVCTEN